MDAPQARQIVLISMLGTGGIVVYDLISHQALTGDEKFRAVWSIALLFLLLAILADAVPELAGPAALLVLLAVAIGRGAALNSIVNIGSGGGLTPGGAPTSKGAQNEG